MKRITIDDVDARYTYVYLNGRPVCPTEVEYDEDTGWGKVLLFFTDNSGKLIPPCSLTDDLAGPEGWAYGHVRVVVDKNQPPHDWVPIKTEILSVYKVPSPD